MIPLVGKGEKGGADLARKKYQAWFCRGAYVHHPGAGGCRGESPGKEWSLDADMGAISLWIAAKFRKDRAPIP